MRVLECNSGHKFKNMFKNIFFLNFDHLEIDTIKRVP